jgi:YHS domain-containing protein
VFRLVLFVVFSIFVARAFWRMVDGVLEGLSGRSSGSNVQSRGVQMVRDPVCGTYVVPDHAVALSHGRGHIFFCSAVCRDKYRAQTG